MTKWPDTDMYFIHPSSPAPLGVEAGEDHPARMIEPGAIISDEQAERMSENESARQAGARMTDQEVGEALGNVVGWPLAVLCVVAVVAAVARVVWGV